MPKPTKNQVVPGFISPGMVDVRFMASLDASQQKNLNLKGMITAASARINNSRTLVIETFLNGTNAEWLWMIDADMTFGPEVLPMLLKTARQTKTKVVAGLCYILVKRTGTIAPNAFIDNPKHGEPGQPPYTSWFDHPIDEPFEVQATGSAMLLVHRDVLTDVQDLGYKGYPWFDERYNESSDSMIGPDIVFSERVREAGYTITYEPRVEVGHIKDSVVGRGEFLQWLQLQQAQS